MAEYVKVGETTGFTSGTIRPAEVGGRTIAIANVDGHYHAVDGTCTHLGGPLPEGELTGTVLTCPWHGGQFDVRTGQVLRAPPGREVRVYPVKVEGGAILVEVPDA